MKKFLLLFLLFVFTTNLFSQIPQTISWQGIIQDGQGNNLNGEYNLSIRFFDTATGGTALWSETHNNVQINDGLANIIIGSITNLNLPFDKEYWLEIQVGNNNPLPRIKLTSVPYSLYSKKASGIIENDSLVLKDSRGVTRMVLNPNTGTFKMMNNDTTWYEVRVQSPKIEYDNNTNVYTVKENIPNGTITYTYNKNGNLLGKSKEEHFETSTGITAHKEIVEYNLNPENNTYYLFRKHEITSKSTSSDSYPEKSETRTTTYYNTNGEISQRDEASSYKTDNPDKPDRESFTKFKAGKMIEKEETTTMFIDAKKKTINERSLFREDGTLYRKRTRIENEDGIEIRDEEFDANGNLIKSIDEQNSYETTAKKTEVKQGNAGTTITQTAEKVVFSNSGSSNSMEIKEDSYLNKIETKFNINGQNKKIFSVDPNETILGPNDQIKMDQFGTTLNGNLKHTGNTTFQGNTSHEGDYHSFNGTLSAKKAKFYDNIEVGDKNQPKDITCWGNLVVDEKGYIYGTLDVNSDLKTKGNFEARGNIYSDGSFLDMKNGEVYIKSLFASRDVSAKGAKKFVIDHPSDNTKMIQHAAIESNNVFNTYFGSTTTGSNSIATVSLPLYFKLINDVNTIYYQLTVESSNFVQAIISSAYNQNTNTFEIKTSSPNTKVHWQVIAKRNDSYMQNNPFFDVISK